MVLCTIAMAEHTFDSSLFSQTVTNPAMISTPLPPPPQEALMPATIKLEMIEGYDNSPSPPQDSSGSSEPSHTPAPESHNGSKPVKKRKSWGQVLPEPKTSLPPRKRAKTEDEKEQRRIERVKRNRLAAHNSRERKRQEYEVLQTEKDELEASMQAYKQKMARMEAELNFYRTKYPGEAPNPVFDLATPPSETICPAQIPTSFPSPESMDSMDSPRDSSCQPETPNSSFEFTPEFDSTQYSAAVLCDLQFDEKPVMENFFDFESFNKPTPATTPVELAFSMDPCSVDFNGSTFFEHSSHSNSCSLLDGFEAKFHDLQTASGATSVSDEALAAGQL
ncbi:bZIP transcription factor [Pyrenophora seminiperda CCB06]|uniref:BZIP transcription factor n=1 Tax=Pyrenophora seminiperda CCB06 TaxID=1302712 RepID=A0A3M7MB17_9PLEO|nr:bZIP transcription factor [Pyrenophora seminiperda CCB06]